MTIIVIVAIVLLLGLAAMTNIRRSRATAARISCVGNLKATGLSFRMWANDNNDQYPMSLGFKDPSLRGDALAGRIYRIFQLLSNELSVPKTISCPADNRWAWVEWEALANTNISYILGLDSADNRPETILSGDRNLAIDGKLLSGAVALGTNSPARWTRKIHREKGNIALADGSVQQITTDEFRQQLAKSGDATNQLVFPQ